MNAVSHVADDICGTTRQREEVEMNPHDISGAFVRSLIEHTSSTPYANGYLVDLPFSYLDGDTIRLFVEETATGVRITDRGDAIVNLNEVGLNEGSPALANDVAAFVRAGKIDRINAGDYELSRISDATDIGRVLTEIAQTAIRIDSLRLRAKPEGKERFSQRLGRGLREAFGKDATVTLHATMPQMGGKSRGRRVTAAVSREGRTAYVQAVSGNDTDTSVSKTFRAFSRSNVERNFRFSALEDSQEIWSPDDIHDLETVSIVTFNSDYDELISRIDRSLGHSFV